jgi:heme/copper-type cytochrome/quinol oxidase subunit 3
MAEGLIYGNPPSVLDVSKLPTVQFGTKSMTWCGIIGMMAIEGMFFVLTIASYFYLHSRSLEWPPHENPPMLFWGTLNLAVFLLSVIPTEWYRRRARKGDGRAVRMGLHVTHLLTDLVDTIVLTVLFFTSQVEGKRFMDASENADYWYFVVVSWIPIYLVVYWAPRWLHA